MTSGCIHPDFVPVQPPEPKIVENSDIYIYMYIIRIHQYTVSS